MFDAPLVTCLIPFVIQTQVSLACGGRKPSFFCSENAHSPRMQYSAERQVQLYRFGHFTYRVEIKIEIVE